MTRDEMVRLAHARAIVAVDLGRSTLIGTLNAVTNTGYRVGDTWFRLCDRWPVCLASDAMRCDDAQQANIRRQP